MLQGGPFCVGSGEGTCTRYVWMLVRRHSAVRPEGRRYRWGRGRGEGAGG